MTQPPAAGSAPSPPAGHPTGTLRLHVQGNILTGMITPSAWINGAPVPTRYGVQDLPVWAGPTHIDLAAQWMRTYGKAGLDINVPPGGMVEVWYAAPWHQFATRGSIGLTKQRRNGALLYGTVLAVCAVAILAAIAAAVVTSL